MHQDPADANSCLSINSMAMNTLSALQYLKVCLSHTEFKVESTTCTRSVTTYSALTHRRRLTREFKCYGARGVVLGKVPGGGISTSEYACAVNTTHCFGGKFRNRELKWPIAKRPRVLTRFL